MDVWWVLQSSAVATLVATVILGIKWLFHDKLDARWHYLIWLVLLVRLLVPVSAGFFRTPVSLLEAVPVLSWLKLCELAVYKAGHGDIARLLLGIYLVGAVVLLAADLMVYLALRIRIGRAKKSFDEGDIWEEAKGKAQGEPDARKADVRRGQQDMWLASAAAAGKVEEVAAMYGLHSCRKICVQRNLSTPYVCGILHPVLVLPEELADKLERAADPGGAGENGDAAFQRQEETVILHELLHQKYRDVLVNVLLHLVRALNWFNPLMWYVVSVVQNDGEALCDQRVLEYMEREGNGAGCEKEYGMLLLRMAEGKEKHPARVGTSNLANSYRNMKTRIHRIADFHKVPEGIGIVTLCITLVLGVSSIGYCREYDKLEDAGISTQREFQLALMKAELFEAKTPEQAVYLYLKAAKSGNPIDLMAVMPQKMRRDYERWALEAYWPDKQLAGSGNWVAQWEENGYFPEDPFLLMSFQVCNLITGGENSGQAEVFVSYGRDDALLWELELTKENGWKVQRKSDVPVEKEQFMGPALFNLSGQGENFIVEIDCWNEGSFNELNTGGFSIAGWNQETGWNMEDAETAGIELPQDFSMKMKMSAAYLSYTGMEDLSGRKVGVVFLPKGTDREEFSDYFKKVEQGAGSGGNGWECGYDNRKGDELMEREKLSVGGGGLGPDSWEADEEPAWHAWIYVDRQCVEEFDVTLESSRG